MRLSILIPTHNDDCTALVKALAEQCRHAVGLEDYEIVISDDASSALFFSALQMRLHSCAATIVAPASPDASSRLHIIHHVHPVGPSLNRRLAIPNLRYDYVLTIDGDARITSPHFIDQYILHRDDAPVVYGGLTTSPQDLRPDNHLRYAYERATSRYQSLSYRQTHPYDHFTAFNTLFHKSLFNQVNFTDQLTQYGFEDTLMGDQLRRRGIAIRHIDNPLQHTGINNNATFVANTELALQNLTCLPRSFQQRVRISHLALRLQRLHLLSPVRLLYRLSGPALRRQLLSPRPSLLVFKVYKLTYLAHLLHCHHADRQTL